MKEKHDDLAEKMRFFERVCLFNSSFYCFFSMIFNQESDINMKEIEEALIILRERKQRQAPNFDFLQKVDDEKAQSKKKNKQII